MAEAASPEATAWAQRAIAARLNAQVVLRASNVPTVVMVGAEDALVSLDEARSAAELGRARLVHVAERGHLLPLEAPDEVTAELVGLADRVAAHHAPHHAPHHAAGAGKGGAAG
ncbi:alpha/beta fold hydrolase [Streptomyces sp. PT12]|uniref:alpha/beta fold hydrolase n=1 Tax=Streptomyces sp. PT12 TaxID=1510197 RepID=UPI0015EF4C6B|nr:alpha/beta hydrolase [Streptomyces sp. PT12]